MTQEHLKDCVGGLITYEYTDGRLSRVVDLNDNETDYEYDEAGRLNRTVGADGRESLVEYDLNGLVVANTDRSNLGTGMKLCVSKSIRL